MSGRDPDGAEHRREVSTQARRRRRPYTSRFFAGLPFDIAKYIQVSSRVRRIHVGSSCCGPRLRNGASATLWKPTTSSTSSNGMIAPPARALGQERAPLNKCPLTRSERRRQTGSFPAKTYGVPVSKPSGCDTGTSLRPLCAASHTRRT